MRMHARGIRSATLAILFACCIALVGVGQGQAREYVIDGTADCGLRSERRCSIGSTLAVWTDDIDGTRQRVEVDVSWIRPSQMDRIDQDDRVCLLIDDIYAGRLKAVGLSHYCRWDGTINPGLSTGSKQVAEQPKRDEDDDDKHPVVGASPVPIVTGPPGTVTGIVTNALTGQPIAGATVRVDGSSASTTTGADGRFTLSGAPSGTRTLRTSANGFITETRVMNIPANSTVDQSIALTPGRPGGEITIVLTWGSQPADLDAHLSGPDRSSGRFHLYYFNPAAPSLDPYATLDVDDITSFGPETITISRDPTTGLFVAGEYRYWVHNFSTSPEFDVSNARVVVNSGAAQLDTFDVPGGASGLDIWRVVNLTIDAAGNVNLTPVQSFASGFDDTPFAVPSGAVPGPTVK